MYTRYVYYVDIYTVQRSSLYVYCIRMFFRMYTRFFFQFFDVLSFLFFIHHVQYIGIEQVSAFSLIMRLSVHLSSYLQGNTNPPHLRSNITIGTQWCFIAGLLGRISLLFLFFLHIGFFFSSSSLVLCYITFFFLVQKSFGAFVFFFQEKSCCCSVIYKVD